MTPLQHLQRLRASLATGCCLEEAERRWLVGSLEEVIRGESKSLDRALGLSGPGIRSLRRIENTATRNAGLARAWSLMPTGYSLSDFADSIQKFSLRKWPIWRKFEFAPSHATDVEAALHAAFHAAFAADLDVPTSPKHLGRILDTMDMNPPVFVSTAVTQDELTATNRSAS